MKLNRDVYNFPQRTASNRSVKSRRAVQGVGINDADYAVRVEIEGKWVVCPAYADWSCLIARCYSNKLHARQPTYTNCTVYEDWLLFSAFKSWWMEQADSTGLDLDKDVRFKGNTIYSPEACQFLSGDVNKLLNVNVARRGKYMLGVRYVEKLGKFVAHVRRGSKLKHLGCFSTEQDAHNAYIQAKNDIIREVANRQHNKLRDELLQHLLSSAQKPSLSGDKQIGVIQ